MVNSPVLLLMECLGRVLFRLQVSLMLLAGLVGGCMSNRQACMLLLNRALPGLALWVLEEAPVLEGDVP